MARSPTVLHARLGEHFVLLDCAAGEYHLLNPTAARMWDTILSNGQRDWRSDPSSAGRGALPDIAPADLETFTDRCRKSGWIVDEDVAEGRPGSTEKARPPLLPIILACRLLRDVRGTLVREGFGVAYDRFVARAPTADPPGGETMLVRAVSVFRVAETLFPDRAAPNDCLPRSLALFGFLRRMGLPAVHRIGVRRQPFAAHAWVECFGATVLDSDDASSFVPLE